jgi:ring-1,2-phenylacetyl-CoA epoxidase subunit PaaE
MAQFHSLKVKHIDALTPNAVAVTLDVPKELAQTFAFTAGQYITIKKEIKGKELRRAYSISSSPKKEDITIGIKRVDHGGFSDYANTKLAVGDVLEVMPPEGRFVFNPEEKKQFSFKKHGNPKNIAAFAAGSGITPIMSIARTVLDSNPKNKMVLVYGNKSHEETMFYTDLAKLELEHPERFFVYFTTSQAREDNALFGRIDTATVNYALKNKHKDLDFDGYYLCGPEEMIQLVSDTLKENEIEASKIHFELFTTTEIQEEMPAKVDGQTALTVVVDDTEYQLTMDRKTLVLDAVLKENIDAPYSCQGGVCSSCIARITEGAAEMVKNQILTDSEIKEGLILTCQAHPTTPILKVDYDDV